MTYRYAVSIFALSFIGLVFWFSGIDVFAQQEFVPLEELPNVNYQSGDPSEFFNSVFRYGVIAAAFLATIMLVIGGFEYMTTRSSPDKKSGAKDKIVGAIGGLFLILLSVLILQVINPDILKFNLLPPIPPQEDKGSGPSAPVEYTLNYIHRNPGVQAKREFFNSLSACQARADVLRADPRQYTVTGACR